MDKNSKLKLLVLIPILAGVALIISGMISPYPSLLYAGIGVLFGGGFLVALVISLTMIVGAVKDTKTERSDRANEVLSEARASAATDGSQEVAETLEKLGRAVEKRRARDRGAKVFSILFVAAFIGCLFGGMILIGTGFYIAGGIVFGCAPLMVLIAITVSSIKNRVSGKRRDASFIDVGTVLSCELKTNPYGSPELARYEVWVEINGDKYYAEADRRYENGDRVKLNIKKNYREIIVEGSTEYSLERGRVPKERLGAPSGERAYVMHEVEPTFVDPEEARKNEKLKDLISRMSEVKRSKLKKDEKMKAYGEIMDEYRRESADAPSEERDAAATVALAKRITEISRSEKSEEEKFDDRRAAVRDWYEGKPIAAPTEEKAEEKTEDRPPVAEPAPTNPTEAKEEKTTFLSEPKDIAPSRRKTSVAYKGINRKK